MLAHPLWRHWQNHKVVPLVPVAKVAKDLPNLLRSRFNLNFGVYVVPSELLDGCHALGFAGAGSTRALVDCRKESFVLVWYARDRKRGP